MLILGLLAWHCWMTLQMFGAEQPWQRLIDDQPIISGRHPLHLYHGYLGSRSLLATHRVTCFDPAFQSAYPKTPIFDSGSRPAELFLTIAGGVYDPAAYKIGLVCCCALVPLLVIIACWGAGWNPAATCLATGASLLIWWSTPCRRALDAGDIDLLLAALAILAHVGLLIRFDRQPGLLTWQGMLITGCLGWFAQPMLFVMVLPLILIYYLSIGPRHSLTTWHLTLALSEVGALALNGFWLVDWVRHWCLREPLPISDGMLLHRTFATVWTAPQWGDQADRIVAAILLCSALVGIALMNQMHQRVGARLLGLGASGLWVLAILGISWEPLSQVGTAELMVPALWFATLPAAYAWTQIFRFIVYCAGSTWRGVAITAGLLAAVAFSQRDLVELVAERCRETPVFALGIGSDRETMLVTLQQTTTQHARILWEDTSHGDETQRWTALLPVLTGRFYIGGLDSSGIIEHTKPALVDNLLCGKPLTLWTDTELTAYCQRHNIGWIVSRSSDSTARFRAWSGASETAFLKDGQPRYLFTVVNAQHSYALKGQATMVHMDSHHITFADVIPNEKGVVELSLHYQRGLHATPERVVVEPADDGKELIPFVRLRLDRPVARLTLTWHDR